MATIHGSSAKNVKIFKEQSASLEVYWVYCSRSNSEGVSWPSLSGLNRDTGWSRDTCLDARRWLVEHKALEIREGYIRREWRELPEAERKQKINLDRSEYYHVTGFIEVGGKRYDLLYFGMSEDEEDSRRRSTPSTIDPVDPNLVPVSTELDTIKDIEPSGSAVYSLRPTIAVKRDSLPYNLEMSQSSKVDFSRYPTIMECLVPILEKNSVKVSLSNNQLEELSKEVATPVGKLPSPQDEYATYPAAFREFLRELPKTATWQKRFTEGRKRLTVGTLIEMVRGYHWKGGWLEYRPKESTTEKLSTDTGDWDQ